MNSECSPEEGSVPGSERVTEPVGVCPRDKGGIVSVLAWSRLYDVIDAGADGGSWNDRDVPVLAGVCARDEGARDVMLALSDGYKKLALEAVDGTDEGCTYEEDEDGVCREDGGSVTMLALSS